ncbi:MAG: zinc ribbon domain-containing protein [Firmicutes bacterium]|nr:zinc ribbon domain-containing protein [Bacillota bacterium]
MDGSLRQCPKCGSVLEEGAQSCGGCGRPMRRSKAAGSGGGARKWMPIAIAAVSGLVFGAVLYFGIDYLNSRPQTPTDQPAATTAPSTAKAPVTAAKPNTAAAPSTQSGIKLEDFAGTWVVSDEEGGEVVLRLNGTKVSGVAGPEKDSRIDLSLEDNGLLKGTITPAGEKPVPLTVELSSDKKKIILTAAPPESEYFVTVAWKQGQGPNQPGGDKTSDAAARVTAVATGLGLDPQKKIKSPTSVFSPDTQAVFLSAETSGVIGDTSVDVKWTLSTGETVSSPTQSIKENAMVGFSLARPAKGWTKGDYRAVVYLNGKESVRADFSVK